MVPRPAGSPGPAPGMGITTMRRRVETMGGRLRTESAGWGFRVMATIPDEVTP